MVLLLEADDWIIQVTKQTIGGVILLLLSPYVYTSLDTCFSCENLQGMFFVHSESNSAPL